MPSRKNDPLDDILPLLHSRAFGRAIPRLEKLARSGPQRADVLYNLGLALSETRQFPEAVIALKRCVELDADYQHAWIAIGVAYGQLRKFKEARDALSKALRLNPNDGLTLQNLSGVLVQLGEYETAAESARRAFRLLPPNPRTHWAMAEAVKAWAFDPLAGDQQSALRSEASDAYKSFLELYPGNPMEEAAEQALTSIASTALRARGVGGFRPDVFEYIVYALRLFDRIGANARNHLTLEIAKVTADGVDINSPETRHAVKGLEGDFTALQLVSFLYTGMQQVRPDVNVGVDFSLEYEAAQSFLGRQQTPGDANGALA